MASSSAAGAASAAAAGWLVSPLLQCLNDRAKSCAEDLTRYLPGGAGDAHADVVRLSDCLLRLHASAYAVERTRRRPSDPTLAAWLRRLKDAAHDADDLLDDIRYDRLTESLAAPRPKLRRILDYSRSLCRRLFFSDDPLSRLPSVLEKLEAASAAYNGVVHLDAAASPQPGSPLARKFSSAIPDDKTLFGRGRELAGLVERLVGCSGPAQHGNQGVPVVAIVGDGGIGKTTLAQMAFNHLNIQVHFDVRMWVCVSSCMDVMKLTREILQQTTEEKDYGGVVSFSKLQDLLISAVAGKRFLLVLDDVWDDNGWKLWENRDQWRSLLAPLQNGQQESRIVVTTRMKMVADMLGVRIPIMLVGLGTEEHWLLLKKFALGCEKSCEYPQLQEIGRKIALKLRGSPLAAKVTGGMLSVTRSTRDWISILETDIHGDIVSTLLSSYYHLPPHLQCCFAYCSIFPKNWKFEPKKLVRMWISQGFIQMENGRSMEYFGREYFKQLLSRSFFHTLKRGNKMLYVMHDLIHDLSQMVSDGDCMRIEGDMSKSVLPTVRHLSVSSKSLGQIMNQYGLKRLRTLIVFGDPLMPPSPIPNGFLAEIKNVRTLDFSGWDISELPEAIGLLTHLRYMALPDTIKILPESVSRLLHLQTFDIPKKCQLNRFPGGMHQLASLRHLGVDSKYISMIRGIGSLVNLQGSVEFHVKKEKGQTLEELKDMRDLHGVLNIKNLENVQCREEARKAQLAHKQYVKILKLEWSFPNTGFGPTMDANVLDCLQPHPNLEELHIARYKGETSPRWLEVKTLSHLKSIYLANCRRWMLLPPLGQLPLLRVLHLKEMSSVVEIGLTFYGGSMAFPSLKDLEFDDMPNLVCWKGETSNSFFPSLQKLKISDCPKLVEVPLLPRTIKTLTVERSRRISHLKLSPYCSFKSSKFTLEISSGSILSEVFLHQQHLEATEVLNIRGCWGSVTAPNFQVLTSLRKLRLFQCDMDGARLNSCLQHLTDLAFLEIIDCQNIMSFVLPVGSRYSTTLQHLCLEGCLNISSLATLESFTFLKSLIIERCPRVTAESLPSELKRMISLNKLSISHCPGFESLPSSIPQSLEFLHLVGCHPRLTQGLLERQGPEWDKVAFISRITIH
ncbi:hypothetical protein ACQ4PT_010645 [Festuca glaucescens]